MSPKKPLGDKPMEKSLTIRTTDDFLKALEEAKWQLRMDKSSIIRKAVEEYITNHFSQKELKKIRKYFKSSK
jgi:predicted transcriptional regulator